MSENFPFSFYFLKLHRESANDQFFVEKKLSFSTKFVFDAKFQNIAFWNMPNLGLGCNSVSLNMNFKVNESFELLKFEGNVSSKRSRSIKKWKYVYSDNLGQTIVDKFTKLCERGFSIECFNAVFAIFLHNF